MSYLALYRKYRPLTFDDVIGQDTTIKILKNSIKDGKIGHAYLFCGPRGTGKTTIAKILARAVNCLNSIDGNLCGDCENCKKLLENDTDIIEIDAASNNGVEDIREIRNNAKLMPNIGKYKVYIIDEVHMLSTGAFNAMLKTLEEPPAHVIFILATTEVQKIPVTILSRCQKFDFQKIPNDIMLKRLNEILDLESKKINDNILNLIVKLSDGCCRDAVNLLDQILSIGDEKVTEEDVYNISGDIDDNKLNKLINAIINCDYNTGLDIINELNETGKNLNMIVNKMLIMFRNISVFKYNDLQFNEEQKKMLSNYNLEDKNILESTKILLELSNELKKSTMQKLIFEIYFMKLCNTYKDNFSKSTIEELHVLTEQKQIEHNDKDNNSTSSMRESKLNDLKKIRICNVLARADKNILTEIKVLYQNIDEYSSNKTYNNVYSILSEGQPIVASEEYIMLMFEYTSTISLLEKNIIEVEGLMKKVLKSNYKIVAISVDEWKVIRQEYIKNKEKFTYIKETEVQEKENPNIEKNSNNTVFDIFGEDNVIIK